MKKFILFISILSLAVGCSQPEIEIYGSISGLVKNSQTSELLTGVRVTLSPGGTSQITAEDGAFSFEELKSGEYSLTFSKDGFEDESSKVSVKTGVSANVQITMAPIQPKLNVSTNVLSFGEEATTLSLDISNSGKGILEWEVANNVDWIECSPTSGAVSTKTNTVVVSAKRESLDQGNYSGSFVISSNGGSATILVSISINGITLQVEPAELDFGTITNSLQIKLTNTASGTLAYEATSSNDWLTLNKTSGNITTNDYITAVVSRQGLSAGKYDGSITFATKKGALAVPVKMEIAVNETPTVTTESVSEIKYNSALLHGTVVSVGSDKITRYGFCWGEKSKPTIEDNFSNLGDCSTAEAFESIANNLKPETKYYFRAYAENSVGLVYSEKTLSFTTTGLPSLPGVSTGSVENVTANTARAKGTLTSLGNVDKITHYGHVWGLSAKPTLEDAKYSDLGEATATSSFVSDVSGLTSHTTYYIRAYATNEKGTSYGEDVSFVTSKEDAKVSTSEVTEIVHNAATCGGVITQTGGHTITEKGVCYGKNALPTVNDSKQVATSEKDASFSCRITGLEKETTYYVRAYVKTSDNTLFYGDDLSFKTTKEVKLPTLSSVTISNIQTTSATFVGTIISDGESEITECGFCWSDVAEPTIVDNKASCDPQSKEMGKNITSLKEGTKYYVRAYAKNAMGYAYSEVASFETQAITVPSLSNTTIENIGKTTADASASIVSNGNSPILEVGFCWSTSPNPTIYDNTVTGNVSSNPVSITINGLPGLTTIFVRAFAKNSKGVGYGESTSFQTTNSDIDVWDGTAASSFDGGSGTNMDPIQIRTGEQLALLAKKVNSGTTYDGIYFVLTSNINLKDIKWTPIGGVLDAYGSSGIFKGKFNGQGHYIYGLNINISGDCIGLFGNIYNAEIKNLHLSGKVIGRQYVGMLFGRGLATINNIVTEGRVEGTNTVGGIGGMLAEIGSAYNSGELLNSSNMATVIASSGSAGGLLGGDTGYNSGGESSIINCINYGTVQGNSGGGIRSASHGGLLENVCNYSQVQSGYAIQQGFYYYLSFINCFWLNDVTNDFGCEKGWKESSMNVGHTIKNSGSFSRNSRQCTLITLDNKDVVNELNQWVSENGEDKYLLWHYETVDGYARPALNNNRTL